MRDGLREEAKQGRERERADLACSSSSTDGVLSQSACSSPLSASTKDASGPAADLPLAFEAVKVAVQSACRASLVPISRTAKCGANAWMPCKSGVACTEAVHVLVVALARRRDSFALSGKDTFFALW